MIVPVASDTTVVEEAPNANFGNLGALSLRNNSGHHRYAFLYFPRPFPVGATILSATLKLYIRGSWTGSQTIAAKRVTSTWSESRTNYTHQPTVTATNAGGVVVTGGTSSQLVSIDITSMMQDVSSGGGTLYGVRLESSGSSLRTLYSSEIVPATLRPYVEITWSEAPHDPDQLVPNGQVVSAPDPTLRWRFSDNVGNTQQASSRVQVASDAGFSSLVYDSAKTANLQSTWDLSADPAWDDADLPDPTTLYWRVMVWDGTDIASGWSAGASMTRNDLGVLSVSDPGASVADTTPTIAWTLSGETQESYRATLFRVETNGAWTYLWQEHAAGTTNQVTVPSNLIVTGPTYVVRVEVWDTRDRALDERLVDDTTHFVYLRDGTPDPVETLTVQPAANSPMVTLTWTRTDAPDYWCLRVNGHEIDDRISVGDTFVSGTTYTMTYWHATQRVLHNYEIEAVVSSGGGAYQHSADNPIIDATTSPTGIWLIDPTDDTAAQILGQEDAPLAIGESGTTYNMIGAPAPVRITDVVRGYEGSISGVLLGSDMRDTFLALKERQAALVLVISDLSIPIRLEAVMVSPTPAPGEEVYKVSFSFFQCGRPWPVDNV